MNKINIETISKLSSLYAEDTEMDRHKTKCHNFVLSSVNIIKIVDNNSSLSGLS